MRRSNRSILSEGMPAMPDMFSERDALAKRLQSLEDTFNKSLNLLAKNNAQEKVENIHRSYLLRKIWRFATVKQTKDRHLHMAKIENKLSNYRLKFFSFPSGVWGLGFGVWGLG